MNKSAYIITTPLQYINATNIPDDLIKDCLFISSFAYFDQFHQNVKQYSEHWNQILQFKNRYLALLYVFFRKRKYSKIFLDSDFGIITRLLLRLLCPLNIFVYEEGYGNYRKTIRSNKGGINQLKNDIDILLGYNFLGGFYGIKGIYLYNPLAFNQLVFRNFDDKLLNFKKPFLEHLNSLEEMSSLLLKVYNKNEFEGKDVLVYLTSWEINISYKSFITNHPNHIKILKPHPHLKKNTGVEADFDITITSALPAELLIANISSVAKSIVVLHQGSTALLYFTNWANVVQHNLTKGAHRKAFEDIKSYFVNFGNKT